MQDKIGVCILYNSHVGRSTRGGFEWDIKAMQRVTEQVTGNVERIAENARKRTLTGSARLSHCLNGGKDE